MVSGVIVSNRSNPDSRFPYWAWFEDGIPQLVDNDFSTLGGRYGNFLSGGSTIARDATKGWSQNACVLLTTGAGLTDQSEVKLPLFAMQGLISFEHKILIGSPHVGGVFDWGVELRGSVNAVRARFRIFITGGAGTDEIKYESSLNTYTSFNPPLIIPRAIASTNGDNWLTFRYVVDITNQKYISFYAMTLGSANVSGTAIKYDMTALNGGAGQSFVTVAGLTGSLQLIFVSCQNAQALAQTMRTTDWIISQVPHG